VSAHRGVERVLLGVGVEGFFTGSAIDDLADANLAHHRPHVPERLARARDRVAELTRTDATAWTMMRQVHRADVGVVDERTPSGAEIRDVDVLVTLIPDRPLVVLSADCLPIVAAGRRAIGVAHAGWRGIAADVPEALVSAFVALDERPEDIRVVIGPAIGPCCYAVGQEVIDAVAPLARDAVTVTSAGRPSVDLRRAAHERFSALGVSEVSDVGARTGGAVVCTACDARWFSHRRDPSCGRQAGIIVRRSPGTAGRGPT
jgi:YfiH family protein